MASDTAPDSKAQDTLARQSDEDASPVTQRLEQFEDRLLTLSEKMTLCNRILKDLRDLNSVLVKKALRDVSLPTQE